MKFRTFKIFAAVLLAACLQLSAGIQYSGCTVADCLQNTTFAADDRPTLIAGLRDKVIAAGWSVISGAGTTDVILQSVSTPNTNHIQVRLYDSGAAAQIFLRNVAGTKISQAFTLAVGAGKVYKFLGNKYQSFAFTAGSTPNGEFVAVSVPYVPTFLAASITGDFGFIQGNATGGNNMRGCLACYTNGSLFSGLVNNNLLNLTTGYHGEQFDIVVPFSVAGGPYPAYKWLDDSLFVAEPLVGWGLTAGSDVRKLNGQLWDAVTVSGAFTGDTTITLDSKNWYAVTNNNATGTLFVLVP